MILKPSALIFIISSLFCNVTTFVSGLALYGRYVLGGVYMRKLAPARVSYQDDFFISHRIYMMTGSFHISLVEGTLHVDKIQV